VRQEVLQQLLRYQPKGRPWWQVIIAMEDGSVESPGISPKDIEKFLAIAPDYGLEIIPPMSEP
jgi:hypothetical protein